jgi:hypothetical protein
MSRSDPKNDQFFGIFRVFVLADYIEYIHMSKTNSQIQNHYYLDPICDLSTAEIKVGPPPEKMTISLIGNKLVI